MADEAVELLVTDGSGWRAWLEAHVDEPAGVWLVLAKKGTTPTSLTYAEALDVALAHGWIDGLVGAERRARRAPVARGTHAPGRHRGDGTCEGYGRWPSR